MKLNGTHFNSGVTNGNIFVQTRFRSDNGVSLHPLQRQGLVPMSSHDTFPIAGGAGPDGWHKAPAAAGFWAVLATTQPRVLPLAGSPNDPAMQI